MSRVEQLEQQVSELTEDELREFSEWFAEFDAQQWDMQIEADSKNNSKLKAMIEQARQDHRNGLTQEL